MRRVTRASLELATSPSASFTAPSSHVHHVSNLNNQQKQLIAVHETSPGLQSAPEALAQASGYLRFFFADGDASRLISLLTGRAKL